MSAVAMRKEAPVDEAGAEIDIDGARKRFAAGVNEVSEIMQERTDVVRSIRLSLLARCHGLLVGPPGEGKSRLLALFMILINGSRFFKKLLGAFDTPDDLFGAPDLIELQKGSLVRKGAALFSHIWLLDEYGRATTELRNMTNACLEEREYDQDGVQQKINLITAWGASNSWPASEDDAAPLDRLAFRHFVGRLKMDESKKNVYKQSIGLGGPLVPSTLITLEELRAMTCATALVGHKDPKATDAFIDNTMIPLENELAKAGIDISTRRRKLLLPIAQASAFVNGRDELSPLDLTPLANVLANLPEQMKTVQEIVMKIASPVGFEVTEIVRTGEEAWTQATKLIDASTGRVPDGTALMQINHNMNSLRRRLKGMKKSHPELSGDIEDALKRISGDHIKVKRLLVEETTEKDDDDDADA